MFVRLTNDYLRCYKHSRCHRVLDISPILSYIYQAERQLKLWLHAAGQAGLGSGSNRRLFLVSCLFDWSDWEEYRKTEGCCEESIVIHVYCLEGIDNRIPRQVLQCRTSIRSSKHVSMHSLSPTRTRRIIEVGKASHHAMQGKVFAFHPTYITQADSCNSIQTNIRRA